MPELSGPDAKRVLNEQFARLAAALAHPGRVELLELLAQGEQPVETLVDLTGMGSRNTSAQLQVLRRARLVESRKDGRRVLYRLADDDVARFLGALRDAARARLSDVEQVLRDYFSARDELEPLDRTDLVRRLREGDVVVIDVRPRPEYEAGHIPGALSVPLDDLLRDDRLAAELPADRDIVAYCRGPYCVMAAEAVARLRQAGRRALRLEGGMPEWKLDGLAVARGAEETAA